MADVADGTGAEADTALRHKAIDTATPYTKTLGLLHSLILTATRLPSVQANGTQAIRIKGLLASGKDMPQ